MAAVEILQDLVQQIALDAAGALFPEVMVWITDWNLGVKGLLQLAGVIASSEAKQALSSLVRPSSTGEK